MSAKNKPSSTVSRLLIDLFRSRPRLFVLATLLSIVQPFCSGMNIVLLIPIMNAANVSTTTTTTGTITPAVNNVFSSLSIAPSLPVVLMVFLAVTTANAALIWYQTCASGRLRLGFTQSLQERLFYGIGQTQWSFFLKSRPQDIAHALSLEAERVQRGLLATMSLISSVALVTIYLALSAWLSLPLTAMAVISALLLAPAIIPSVRATRRSGRKMTDLARRIYRDVLDHLAGMKEARIHNSQAIHAAEFSLLTSGMAQTRLGFEFTRGAMRFSFTFGSAAAMSLIIYFSIVVLQIPAVDLFLLIVIFARMTPPLLQIQNDYQELVYSLPAYASICNLQEQYASFAEGSLCNEQTAFADTIQSINLADVGFRYDRHIPNWALRNVSLTIPAGEVTAIVGTSGSGKSTLADMLLGLLPPEEGTICADGVDLHSNLIAWRQLVGYVPQETFLLHDTIRANLLWSRPSASDQEINDALKLASVDNVVRDSPEGLDTIVGERGIRFSGGERQRISLARALLRKPAVLILDEATSALDAQNQRSILASLRGLSNVAIVMIAHSRSAIDNAQQVVVLDNGHIVQRGSPESLAKEAGNFRDLMCRQPSAA